MKPTKFFSAFFILSFFAPLLVAQNSIDLLKLDEYIKKSQTQWNVPGMAIGIVKDGKIIFAKGYGVKNVETKAPVNEHTLFAIASNTKAFTAAAISILVDEGRLNLDDKVIKYLPYFQLYNPYVTHEITVRDLLCHRTGLETFSGDLLWYESTYSRKEIIKRARFLKPAYGFRTTFGYSNIMFIAAGEVIEAITDSTWEQYIEAKFLQPLHMKNTNTSIKYLTNKVNYAQPHNVNPGEKAVPIKYMNWDNCAPAAALNSNVSEMCNWLIMNLNNGNFEGKQLVSEKQIWEMQTPHTIMPVSRFAKKMYPTKHFEAYGLGLEIEDSHGTKVLSHGGGADGMISKVMFIPEEKLGVVILTNSINYLPSALTNYILEDYFSETPKDWSDLYYRYFKNQFYRALLKTKIWNNLSFFICLNN